MAYCIKIVFDPARPDLRDEYRPKHLEYLAQNTDRLIAAGPLQQDDGSPYGGLTILDTDDRAEAEAFRDNDPFSKSGYVIESAIYKWAKVIFDGKEMGH